MDFHKQDNFKSSKKPRRGLLCDSHPVTARLRANFCSYGLEYWLDVRPKNKDDTKVISSDLVNPIGMIQIRISDPRSLGSHTLKDPTNPP